MPTAGPRITLDPAVLDGKPVVRGTRLSVELVIGLFGGRLERAGHLGRLPGADRRRHHSLPRLRPRPAQSRAGLPDRGLTADPFSMRFLADENIPGRLVETLRRAGHDVAWTRMDRPGADDRVVLARAVAERRIVITFDKDFGELAARSGLSAPSGVILIRLPLARPAAMIPRSATLIGGRPD